MRNRAKIPFFLALRSIKRGNKWTFFLIVLLVSIAFINLLFLSSLFSGISDMSDNQAINTYAASITITPSENHNFIDNSSDKIDKIKTINGVVSAAPRVIAPVTLEYGNIKGNWQTYAIDPNQEKSVTNVADKIYEGSYLDAASDDEIILGKEVAGGPAADMNSSSLKGAKVGDKVIVTMNGSSKEFTVKGLFFTKFMFTDRLVFMSIDALKQFMPSLGDNATSINVLTKNKGEESKIIQSIKDLGIEGNMDDWRENAGFMRSVNKTFDSISTILDIVGALIAAVTIFIIISIDVSTKRQEIGVLRAIGIRPSLIIFTYVLQAAIYSFLGITLGLVVFTTFIMPYYVSHPFPLPMGDATLVIASGNIMYKAVLVFVLAIISAVIPSTTATRVKILDSIKS